MWDGPRRYIAIVVHETQKEFQKAVNKRDKNANWAGVVGAFHPAVVRENYNRKTKEWDVLTKHFAGTMRLSKEMLDDDVMIHESVHAAAHIYRMDVADVVDIGEVCGPAEEKLAYIVGDLSSAVALELNKAEIW